MTFFVSIPYLRERLRPLGDSFAVSLHGLRTFSFTDLDERKVTSKLEDITRSGIEIISTDSTSMPVKVATTQGFLTLEFERLEVRLDTGREATFEEIDAAFRDYWEEWQKKAEKTAQPGATDNPVSAPRNLR